LTHGQSVKGQSRILVGLLICRDKTDLGITCRDTPEDEARVISREVAEGASLRAETEERVASVIAGGDELRRISSKIETESAGESPLIVRAGEISGDSSIDAEMGGSEKVVNTFLNFFPIFFFF
jgi:hypothetical protein